ncbi:MAG: TonB-dependent receptor [Bacteroidota bacterium]
MAKRLITLFLLGIMALPHAFSQDAFLIGLVLSKDSLPLQGASVVVTSDEDQSKQGALTSERGRYRFKGLQPGPHTITVEYVGYEAFSKQINLTEGPNFAGRIVLGEKSYELDAVVIKGQVPPAQQKGDTTEYNADAFKTNPDATAENLLEKMPGVVVQNGQVQAQGEAVRQVLVDGKAFFGNDPNAALKNLPAEVIQKIQVFDQKSEQAQQTGFDDGERTKTINIITKPEMRNGTFGRVFGGAGTENYDALDRYNAGFSLNNFNGDRRISILGQSNNINQQNFSNEDLLGVVSANGASRRGFRGGRPRRGGDASDFLVNEQGGISTTNSAGINYTDKWGKKIEVAGSYFFNQSDNISETNLRQEYISSGDNGQIYEEEEESNSSNINHRFNLRLEIKPDDKTSIVYRPRLTIQQNEGSSFTSATTLVGSQLLNTSTTDFESDLTGLSTRHQLSYRRRFAKRGRSISVSVNAQYDEQSGNNFLKSGINYFSEPASVDTIDQKGTLQSTTWNTSANIRYTEPISDKGMLQLYYRVNPQLEESDQQTLNDPLGTGSYSLLDTALTNTFESNYTTQQVGAGMFFRGGKAFFITRVAYQFAQLDNQRIFPVEDQQVRNFNNLVPFALLRYRFSRSNDLRVIYRGSTSPPSVDQLQDVINNSNPLQITSGNPELDQNYSHRVILRYNKTNTKNNSVLVAFANGTFTENYVGNHTIRLNQDTTLANGYLLPAGSQYIFPVNLDGYFQGRVFVSTGRLIEAIKMNVNLDLSVDYRRQPGLINNRLNLANTTTGGFGLTLSSNISENWDFTVSSRTTANQVINSLQSTQNSNYLQQDSRARLNVILPGQVVFRSNISHTLYTGLSQDFNQNFWLWSLGLGKKFLKNNRGELYLSVFDALGQNTSITRTVNENYIEDLQSLVLQRYVMLTFTYNIRAFTDGKGDKLNLPNTGNDRRGGPPGRPDFRPRN